jgi:branched-chain amino acid transport system permease protein
MKKNLPLIGYAVGFALLLAAPLLFYPVLVMKVLCYALFACAFNLLLGYTGLLSFGHAAFFGTAAYVAGHAIQAWGMPSLIGVLIGTGAAAVLGYVFGALAIRRQGIYFAMITLALAQMMFFYFLQAEFTGGENGLQGVPRGTLFGLDLSNDRNMYYVVVALFSLAFWLIYRTIHSPFGQILKAIRENEPRAISLGYDVNKYKLVAFVLSATLAGLAGALKMLVFNNATLSDAYWQTSGEVVLMTLLGGMGTPFGPVVGAAIIVVLQDELPESIASMVTVITGAIFVVCVLAFRRGIVGEIAAFVRSRSKAPPP